MTTDDFFEFTDVDSELASEAAELFPKIISSLSTLDVADSVDQCRIEYVADMVGRLAISFGKWNTARVAKDRQL